MSVFFLVGGAQWINLHVALSGSWTVELINEFTITRSHHNSLHSVWLLIDIFSANLIPSNKTEWKARRKDKTSMEIKSK